MKLFELREERRLGRILISSGVEFPDAKISLKSSQGIRRGEDDEERGIRIQGEFYELREEIFNKLERLKES